MCDTHFEYQVDHEDVLPKRGNAIVRYTHTLTYTIRSPANITNLMTGIPPREMMESMENIKM